MAIIKQENLLSEVKKIKILKKIVMCHGVFDVLHLAHIKHFEEAKKLGDILIVSVTSNKFVNKGFERPYFDTLEWRHLLSKLYRLCCGKQFSNS